MSAYDKIEKMQRGIENTAPWMVGEQLKEICSREPACEDILDRNLNVPKMSLVNAEKQIKAWADKQKRNGNCVCVPPSKAEEIIRKFYGLPERGAGQAQTQRAKPAGMLSLEDLL